MKGGLFAGVSIGALLVASCHASAGDGASFNCKKAGTATEKAICANPALANLDGKLGQVFKAYVAEFPEAGQKNRLRASQTAWLAERNRCEARADCLQQAYSTRLRQLQGKDPAMPAAGIYTLKNTGSIVLFPDGTRYLAAIRTAEPKEGRWTCEVDGEVTGAGTALQFKPAEGAAFPLSHPNADTVEIPNTEAVQAAQENHCGLNGRFSFTYRRAGG